MNAKGVRTWTLASINGNTRYGSKILLNRFALTSGGLRLMVATWARLWETSHNGSCRQGLPWCERMSDIPAVYAEIKRERDCFEKFSRAAYFAKYLGREEEYQSYRSKMEQEAHRIDRANLLALYP